MRKLPVALALILILAASGGLGAQTTAKAKTAKGGAPAVKAIVYPAPEYLSYRPETIKKMRKAYSLYSSGKVDPAVKVALEALDTEPTCMELRWFLANVYKSKGEIGSMLSMLSSLGIRESKESAYERQVVYQGSRGYVLQVNENTLRVDFTDSEVKPGDALVVYAEGAALQHPVTMQILYVEKRLVAEIEVKSASSSHSIAEIVKLYGEVTPAMRVMLKSEYNGMIDSTADTATPTKTP